MIDGAANLTTTVSAGTQPQAVVVNPVTNQVYVTNLMSNTVTVIDGPTNLVAATIGVDSGPGAVAVNPLTNQVYVAHPAASRS